MSNHSSVLVTIDKFLKLLNNSNGRDKCTKVLQYSTRIVDDVLSSQTTPNKEAIKRVQAFGTGIATARKVFRFWKPLVGYLALLRFIQRVLRLSQGGAQKEKALRIVEVLQLLEKLFVSNYFLFDHLNWAAKIGLLSNDKVIENSYDVKSLFNNTRAVRYGQIGMSFWMWGSLCGVVANGIDLADHMNKENGILVEMNAQLQPSKSTTTTDIETNRSKRMKELELQMIQLTVLRNAILRREVASLCDLGTAASLGGYWNAPNWLVGVLGITSAMIGVYEGWPEQ